MSMTTKPEENWWTRWGLAAFLIACSVVPIATCSIALINDRDNQPVNEEPKYWIENGLVVQDIPRNCEVVDSAHAGIFTWKQFCIKHEPMSTMGGCVEQVFIKCHPMK